MLRSNVLARIAIFLCLILTVSTINTNAQNYPIADFYSNVTSGDAPLTVAFTDASTGISNSWMWSFGDGYASDIRNPTHTYSTAGTYTVKLTVKNNLDVTNTNIKTNYITVNGATNAPFAHFTSNNAYGSAPLSVSFTDTSSGSPTRWLWEFGDGAVCPDQNPVYTYSTAGTYTVKLTATNDAGSNTVIQSNYVIVEYTPHLPVTGFKSSVTSGTAPLAVAFTDTSTGSPTAWTWNFGDGELSTRQNPIHTYIDAGSYTVSLNVTNNDGSNTLFKDSYILTNPYKPPTYQPSRSINLYSDKTNISRGESVYIKLSAVNSFTNPTMHIQVNLIPQSGLSVFSSDYIDSGNGQYTSTFDIKPGQNNAIKLGILANQEGTFNVKGWAHYYYGNNIADAEDYQLNLPIFVSEPQTKTTPMSTPAPPRTSGFGAVSLVFILIMVFLLKRH